MACVYMMEYIRGNLFLPGQVENAVIILDVDHMGLLNIPYRVQLIQIFF